jgi:uncharacterized protein (TIGR03083 family)
MTPDSDQRLRAEIAVIRRELADFLAALPADSWDAPTLCAGWRVREVVAHVTMPFRYSTGRFLAELARSGMSFHRMTDRCARRDAAVPVADLVAAVRDNATNPWRPPGGGYEGALIHDVIHGLDIMVPLGVDRPIPAARMLTVLDGVTKPASRKHFGVDLTGVELRADDLDWSFGTGTVVSGPARDLALLLCGRAVPVGRLAGAAAGRFSG